MTKYVCGSDKYLYDKGYIYLPIKLEKELPIEIEIENTKLYLKSSFHVSLLCTKNIFDKYPEKELENKIITSFCNFISNKNISLVKILNEFRFANSGERKTLIVRCEISYLNEFFKELSQEINMDIPLQPTHITLYTLQPDIGIGLNSFRELEEKSIVVKVPDEIKDSLNLI